MLSGIPIAFSGGLSGLFLGVLALTSLVVIANVGLLWWQDRADRRRHGPS